MSARQAVVTVVQHLAFEDLGSFAQPLRELGHDPEPLLRRYGLDATRLGEAGARLSIPRYMHLGHAAIEMSGEAALGLRMGRLSRLAHAGLAGVTAAQAPTLGEAARTLLQQAVGKAAGRLTDI